MAGQGFASLSEVQRKAMAKRGGKAAVMKNRKHTWTPEQARIASAKGVQKRKQNQAREALIMLADMGFTMEQLQPLTVDELIEYGKNPEALREKLDISTSD